MLVDVTEAFGPQAQQAGKPRAYRRRGFQPLIEIVAVVCSNVLVEAQCLFLLNPLLLTRPLSSCKGYIVDFDRALALSEVSIGLCTWIPLDRHLPHAAPLGYECVPDGGFHNCVPT